MASMCFIAVAAAVYFICGFSWQGYIGGPAHSFNVAGKGWNWIAAEPFFLRGSGSGDAGQWLAQLVGVATLLGFVLPLTYCLNWLLNRFYPLRVAVEGERQGMDLYELGAGAYPEFVTHTDELTQRKI
jgi:Amt family ammonium transporter